MNTHIETSRTIDIEHVTLDREHHTTVFELADMHDVVLAALDVEPCTTCRQVGRNAVTGQGCSCDAQCPQCGVTFDSLDNTRSDILCEYCASGS